MRLGGIFARSDLHFGYIHGLCAGYRRSVTRKRTGLTMAGSSGPASQKPIKSMMTAELRELSVALPVYPGVKRLCHRTSKAQSDVE